MGSQAGTRVSSVASGGQQKRAGAHIGMWIASTFLTPGADIYSPLILGAAMSSLYELTLLFITFMDKQKAKAEAAEAADND